MKDERELYVEYGDLLGSEADPDLLRLVADLHAASEATQPPAAVAAARERALRQHAEQPAAARRPPPTWWLPRGMGALAAAVLAAILLTTAGYAVVSVLDRVFDLNAGTRRIATQNLGKEINLSRTVDGYTLTLGRVYADANQIVVSYTVRGPAGRPFTGFTYPLGRSLPTLTGEAGEKFELLVGANTGVLAEMSGELLVYNATNVEGKPETLALRLEIPALESTDAGGRSELIGGPFVFDFTVPFEAGRIAEPHQVVESGETSVTLEKVVVTPTGARVRLRGIGPNAVVELSVDGANYKLNPPGATPLQWHTDEAWDYFTPAALVDKQGEWLLVVRPGPPVPPDIQPPPPLIQGGPWEFRFVVP